MSRLKSIWFIVDYGNNNHITFVAEGAIISPYLFSTEALANLACEDHVWPDAISKRLAVRQASQNNFITALRHGFPNIIPRPPDAFSINAKAGDLFSGVVPVTPIGAVLANKLDQTTFWTQLADTPGALRTHATEIVKVTLGLAAAH